MGRVLRKFRHWPLRQYPQPIAEGSLRESDLNVTLPRTTAKNIPQSRLSYRLYGLRKHAVRTIQRGMRPNSGRIPLTWAISTASERSGAVAGNSSSDSLQKEAKGHLNRHSLGHLIDIANLVDFPDSPK